MTLGRTCTRVILCIVHIRVHYTIKGKLPRLVNFNVLYMALIVACVASDPVFSCAHYFQAPATQATLIITLLKANRF